MPHANFACIAICTIHPYNANYLLPVRVLQPAPNNGNLTTCPNVISLTKFVIVEKYGVPTSSDLYTSFRIFT